MPKPAPPNERLAISVGKKRLPSVVMATSNYKRVSRKRACRICGKPDWCSYTPDEKISFCARINTGAERVSRTGWGVFYHEKSLFLIEPFPYPRRPPPKKTELAPLEIRDFAYRKLIELAPASRSKEIIDGEKGLRARKIFDFENYGSLPQKQAERASLAKEIRRLVNLKFPDYVRQQKSGIIGLPGFWLNKNGNARLWLEKDYSCPMMLIPYRSSEGFVQACQIRFMCRKLAGDSVRYIWLSTPEKSGGLSCGSPLHFASYDAFSPDKPILITEGALKSETVKLFINDFDVLACAGITNSHKEIVEAARLRNIYIAFDSDYYENLHVARAFTRLIGLIITSTKAGFHDRIKVLTWDREINGIDDALLQKASITEKSPFEWYKSLSEICQTEVAQILSKFLRKETSTCSISDYNLFFSRI